MTAPKVFISYRRDDAPGSAGRLYDHLAGTFAKDQLFMDVDAMVPGVDFVRELDEAVLGCDVLLAVIGRGWLGAATPAGTRRLDDPEDFVRIEVETGLRQGIRVIPVLVDGAEMPAAKELPEPLRGLTRRHAVEISHTRFAADAERLARTLDVPAAPAAVSSATADDPTSPAPQGVAPGMVAPARVAGAALTVWAIIASGALGNLAAEPGTGYWLARAGPAFYLWAGCNVMVGPAIALKLWLPRFSMPHFWGVLGATFAALAAMLGTRHVLISLFATDLPAGSSTVEAIVSIGLREIPECVVAGAALGYFQAQALSGWFPGGGGPGFVRRMMLIWIGTGAAYGIANFLLIVTMEAAVAVGSGAEIALLARADARMWSDTVLYGAAWALGVALTFRLAARRATA